MSGQRVGNFVRPQDVHIRGIDRGNRPEPLREIAMNMFGAAETSIIVDATGCIRISQEGRSLAARDVVDMCLLVDG